MQPVSHQSGPSPIEDRIYEISRKPIHEENIALGARSVPCELWPAVIQNLLKNKRVEACAKFTHQVAEIVAESDKAAEKVAGINSALMLSNLTGETKQQESVTNGAKEILTAVAISRSLPEKRHLGFFLGELAQACIRCPHIEKEVRVLLKPVLSDNSLSDKVSATLLGFNAHSIEKLFELSRGLEGEARTAPEDCLERRFLEFVIKNGREKNVTESLKDPQKLKILLSLAIESLQAGEGREFKETLLDFVKTTKTEDNQSLLHLVAANGQLGAIQEIFECCGETLRLNQDYLKSFYSEKDKRHKSPLHRAAECGQTATIKAMYELCAQDPRTKQACVRTLFEADKSNRGYVTPLALAAENGHTGTIQAMYKLCAEDPQLKHDFIRSLLSKKYDYRPPLYKAAACGRTDTILEMYNLCEEDRKVQQNFVRACYGGNNRVGSTPLYEAATNGHTATILEMYKLCADSVRLKKAFLSAFFSRTAQNGETSLAQAAANGRTETIQAMFNLCADDPQLKQTFLNDFFSRKDTFGYTPLKYAAEFGHTSIILEMYRNCEMDREMRRAFLSVFFNKNGATSTPLQVAASSGRLTTIRAVYRLCGEDPQLKQDFLNAFIVQNYSYGKQLPPLYDAAKNGHSETIQAMFEFCTEFPELKQAFRKACLSDNNTDRRSPLSIAVEREQTTTVQTLVTILQSETNPELRVEGLNTARVHLSQHLNKLGLDTALSLFSVPELCQLDYAKLNTCLSASPSAARLLFPKSKLTSAFAYTKHLLETDLGYSGVNVITSGVILDGLKPQITADEQGTDKENLTHLVNRALAQNFLHCANLARSLDFSEEQTRQLLRSQQTSLLQDLCSFRDNGELDLQELEKRAQRLITDTSFEALENKLFNVKDMQDAIIRELLAPANDSAANDSNLREKANELLSRNLKTIERWLEASQAWHRIDRKAPAPPFYSEGNWGAFFEGEQSLGSGINARVLCTSSELTREGNDLHHCVGTNGYAEKCLNAESHIISFYHSETLKPLGTLELVPDESGSLLISGQKYKEAQFQALHGDPPEPAVIAAKDELMTRLVQGSLSVKHDTRGCQQAVSEIWLTADEARRKYPDDQLPRGGFIHWTNAYNLSHQHAGKNVIVPVLNGISFHDLALAA